MVTAAIVLAAAVLVGAAWIGSRLAATAAQLRDDARRARAVKLFALFAPVSAAATEDVRTLLAWQPLAACARAMCGEEFAELDRARGTTFPFGAEQIETAHARWSADWLAWELAHDSEYKLKAALLQEELGDSTGSTLGRARLDAVEREKLAGYQRRYEEYTRVSRALQTLLT
jgi:hypothetical protein